MVGKITLNRIFGRICRPIRKLKQNYYNNLKDIHKGKRGFVIGNGPSLKIEDLDNLNNEITIASNKIYLAFEEKQKWRPKFYTVADPILWPKIKNKILNYDLRSIHIPSYLDDIPLEMLNKVKVWRHNKRKKKLYTIFR